MRGVVLDRNKARVVLALACYPDFVYARRVVKDSGIPQATAYRVLESLVSEGVAERRTVGNLKLYRLKDQWRDPEKLAIARIVGEPEEFAGGGRLKRLVERLEWLAEEALSALPREAFHRLVPMLLGVDLLRAPATLERLRLVPEVFGPEERPVRPVSPRNTCTRVKPDFVFTAREDLEGRPFLLRVKRVDEGGERVVWSCEGTVLPSGRAPLIALSRPPTRGSAEAPGVVVVCELDDELEPGMELKLVPVKVDEDKYSFELVKP